MTLNLKNEMCLLFFRSIFMWICMKRSHVFRYFCLFSLKVKQNSMKLFQKTLQSGFFSKIYLTNILIKFTVFTDRRTNSQLPNFNISTEWNLLTHFSIDFHKNISCFSTDEMRKQHRVQRLTIRSAIVFCILLLSRAYISCADVYVPMMRMRFV